MNAHHPHRPLTVVAALGALALTLVLALALTLGAPPRALGRAGADRIVTSALLAGGGALVTTMAPDGSATSRVDVPADLEDFNKTVWSHDGTRLLYSNVMIFDGDGELVAFRPATSAPDGSDFRVLRLRHRPMDMYCSAWSPDDTRILCSNATGDIVSMRVSDGGGLVKLTTNPYDGAQDLAVGYSPDGSRLAWLRERPDASNGAEREALFVADADGTHARRMTRWGLLHAHELAGANWSPDGTHIVSATRQGALVEVDTVAGGATKLEVGLTSDDFAITPDYSPDGKRVVFSVFRDLPSDLYVANLDGSGLLRLTRTANRSELFPDWATPDRMLAAKQRVVLVAMSA
jgi:Tol biopolymer transport system component